MNCLIYSTNNADINISTVKIQLCLVKHLVVMANNNYDIVLGEIRSQRIIPVSRNA